MRRLPISSETKVATHILVSHCWNCSSDHPRSFTSRCHSAPSMVFEVVGGLAGPVSAALAGADDDSLAAIRASTAQALDRFRTADGLLVPGLALVCTGTAAG
jgi:hypothetical protein